MEFALKVNFKKSYFIIHFNYYTVVIWNSGS